jgi:hypothetical protein
VFDINVWDVAAAIKHEIKAIIQTGGGDIVNSSSIAAEVTRNQKSVRVSISG